MAYTTERITGQQNTMISSKMPYASVSSMESSGTGAASNGENAILYSMEKGDVFSGKVMDIRGNNVTIAVGNDIIQGVFQEAVSLCIDEVLQFAVRMRRRDILSFRQCVRRFCRRTRDYTEL